MVQQLLSEDRSNERSSPRTKVVEHLSHLRRYALLTGGERAMVEERLLITLDHLLASHDPNESDIKLALFATYHALLSSLELINPGHDFPHLTAPEVQNEYADAVFSLPLEERQVLILMAMEGFNEEEAAFILDFPIHDIIERNRHARKSIVDFLNLKQQRAQQALTIDPRHRKLGLEAV